MTFKLFRIYPEDWQNKYHYFVKVKLFKTRAEMGKSIVEYMGTPIDDDCQGQCSGYEHYNKRGKLTGNFAAMWLNTEDLKVHAAEIISHECTHAAMRHIINKKVDLSNMAGEEALAYCIGSMTQQVNDRLHKLGVFK